MRSNESGIGYEYSQETGCKKKKKRHLETNASFRFEVISVVAGWQSSGRYTLTLRRKLLLPFTGQKMSYPIRMKV
jgi:hypothetical protein